MNYENMQEYWKGHEDGYNQKQYSNPYQNETDQHQAYANGFQTGKIAIERETHDKISNLP